MINGIMKREESIFDPSLTPSNAGEKGYYYIDDIIYDFLNPNEAIMDILELLREHKGKLGTPVENSLSSYFGLYMPLKI